MNLFTGRSLIVASFGLVSLRYVSRAERPFPWG
jgi:hypothetical protein